MGTGRKRRPGRFTEQQTTWCDKCFNPFVPRNKADTVCRKCRKYAAYRESIRNGR